MFFIFERMKQLTVILFGTAAILLTFSACSGNDNKNDKDDVVETRVKPADMETFGLKNLRKAEDLKSIICQDWENKEDLEDAKYSRGSGLEMVYRGFSFFTDGSMVKNPRGSFQQGSWALNDAKKPYTIEIKYKDGSKENLQIGQADPLNLTLKEASDKKLVNYAGQAMRHEQINDEPYYGANNEWRVRPGKPETEDAIRARLKACVHFYVLFYDHNIHTDAPTVNFSGLPSCFRWYSGGIYLQKEKDLEQSWINCFYDKKQAMQAYKMADDLLSKKYTWPKGETSWLKQNVFVLKQMEKNF